MEVVPVHRLDVVQHTAVLVREPEVAVEVTEVQEARNLTEALLPEAVITAHQVPVAEVVAFREVPQGVREGLLQVLGRVHRAVEEEIKEVQNLYINLSKFAINEKNFHFHRAIDMFSDQCSNNR